MWARIEGERVAEITDIDPDGRFHPSLVWVECPSAVSNEWSFVDGEFVAPVIPPHDPRPEIYAELDQIDRDSARPLRALIVAAKDLGIGTAEREQLEALEARALALRSQLEAIDHQ